MAKLVQRIFTNSVMRQWFFYSLVFMSLLQSLACTSLESQIFPSAEAMVCAPRPRPPIRLSSEAICFAAHIEGLISSLKQAQQQSSYAGWEIVAKQHESNKVWELQIRSSGRIAPAYLCQVSFSESGSVVYRGPQPFNCGYQK